MSRNCGSSRTVLWTAAKSRQKQTRHTIKTAGIGAAKRPQYLFSGLTKCGVCGAGFIMSGKNRLACFGACDQGRCDNHLTIRRDEIETRVLKALQEKLLRQDLFEDFCDEFTREMNRLRWSIASACQPPSERSSGLRSGGRSWSSPSWTASRPARSGTS